MAGFVGGEAEGGMEERRKGPMQIATFMYLHCTRDGQRGEKNRREIIHGKT